MRAHTETPCTCALTLSQAHDIFDTYACPYTHTCLTATTCASDSSNLEDIIRTCTAFVRLATPFQQSGDSRDN